MNEKEFEFLKFLELKYRRGDQIISRSAELVPTKKLGPTSLIWGNFKKLRKVMVNQLEPNEVQ